MSQSRAHRPPVAKNDSSSLKPRTAVGKVTPSTNKPAESRHQPSKCKSKIPKEIRYDLENALVGLCDVWFEEIKPYLLRNNIKIHVNCGDTAQANDGSREVTLPHAACPHLDPGAAPDHQLRVDVHSVNSCSTRLTTLRAPSRKRRVSRPPRLPQLSSPTANNPPSCKSLSPVQGKRLRCKSGKQPNSNTNTSPHCFATVSDNDLKQYNVQPKKLSPKTCRKVKKIVKNKTAQTGDMNLEIEGVRISPIPKKQGPDKNFGVDPQQKTRSPLRHRRGSPPSRSSPTRDAYASEHGKSREKPFRTDQRPTRYENSNMFSSNLGLDSGSSVMNILMNMENEIKSRRKKVPWK